MTTTKKEMTVTAEAKCPSCNQPTQDVVITESCRLAYSKEIDAVNVCVHKTRFIAFRDAVKMAEKTGSELNMDCLDDPCMSCELNEVTEREGTFQRVEMLEPVNGRMRFGEVHKCICGTEFLVVR